jgi:hypothetical protein
MYKVSIKEHISRVAAGKGGLWGGASPEIYKETRKKNYFFLGKFKIKIN